MDASEQSGILQVMLVALYDSTRHSRRPQTSTVGGPMPVANPVPVRMILSFRAALTVDAAVSVGVISELKEKLHGSLEPDVDSEAGSMYMLIVELLPQSWLP